jgi:hypothetical protein
MSESNPTLRDIDRWVNERRPRERAERVIPWFREILAAMTEGEDGPMRYYEFERVYGAMDFGLGEVMAAATLVDNLLTAARSPGPSPKKLLDRAATARAVAEALLAGTWPHDMASCFRTADGVPIIKAFYAGRPLAELPGSVREELEKP